MPSGPLNFDIVIVGNGVVGLACAFALAERRSDLSVVVIGPKSRPGAASVAAGAMLGCYGEVTTHGLSTELGRERFALQLRAKTLWPGWLDSLGERGHTLSLVRGTFVLVNALSGDIEDENFSTILRQLAADGVHHQQVDKCDVPGLRSTTDARAFRAVYVPDEDAINAVEYIGALERILTQTPGVVLLDDVATALRVGDDGSVSGVRIGAGIEINSERVLLAAGVGCQTLIEQCAPLAGRLPKIFAGVGSSIIAGQPPERISHVLRTPNRSFACGLHVVPRGERIYIGATNTVSDAQETSPRLVDIQFLLDCVIPQISEPLHASAMFSTATGCRPVASDGFPLIGDTSVEGLFIATGTFRDGIQLSPLLAQHMADLLVGGHGLLDDVFHPVRQPLWTLTIDEAVDLCARHYLSVFYENGCRLPTVGWEELLLDLMKNEVREMYKEYGDERLPPIDFIHLLRARKKSGTSAQLL
ncbi:MAG TPA: FAD-dependent oxidoreductase [Pyrinomonadaceae bacterium]